MADFKLGDKVVVRPDIASAYPGWTEGKVYTVDVIGKVLVVFDDRGHRRLASAPELLLAPDADGWHPMPKLKKGDPIPEWLLDEVTQYRGVLGNEYWPTDVLLSAVCGGLITHYRPAPKAEIATTPNGKQYRITHCPDGSVTAEML